MVKRLQLTTTSKQQMRHFVRCSSNTDFQIAKSTSMNTPIQANKILSGGAWWISRLERYNALGLRGNWLGGSTLHDLMANLLTKKNDPFNYTATDYIAVGDYQVYKYYYLNMTGTRLQTTSSGDRQLDLYTTHDHKKVKSLVGARFNQGIWYVRLDNLGAYE